MFRSLLLISWLLTVSHLYAGDSVIHLSYPTITGSIPIKTWKDLRDDGIEKQDLDHSCGSAAVATILRSFYGQEISVSDLAQAVDEFGFKAIGVSLDFAKLKTLRIPAIVYLRYRDEDHFSVVRGVNEKGLVWLGDPSWGNRKISEFRFKAMWETQEDADLKGKALLIFSDAGSEPEINQAFF